MAVDLNAPRHCEHYKEAVPGIVWKVLMTEVGVGLGE